MTDLDLACEHFKKLLTEQQERLANMNAEKVDYTANPAQPENTTRP